MRTVFAINLEGRGIKLRPGTNLPELIKTEDGIRVLTGHGYELMAIVVLFALAIPCPVLIIMHFQAALVGIRALEVVVLEIFSICSWLLDVDGDESRMMAMMNWRMNLRTHFMIALCEESQMNGIIEDVSEDVKLVALKLRGRASAWWDQLTRALVVERQQHNRGGIREGNTHDVGVRSTPRGNPVRDSTVGGRTSRSGLPENSPIVPANQPTAVGQTVRSQSRGLLSIALSGDLGHRSAE
ncbi:hypothetical protein HHK36_032158 [Tetracentron sinense]|uniref:Uncharacterized protein n=1 Tax=Tetracentron sinense TaxID=13715 RepID=A0A834Y8L7_TETSI|nr:hypothetical protein HHK36_032158 [Tetracentron sinense]